MNFRSKNAVAFIKKTTVLAGLFVAAVSTANYVAADEVNHFATDAFAPLVTQPYASNVLDDFESTVSTNYLRSNSSPASWRGDGVPGPYIATEPIRIINGSREETTAFYNSGGGGGLRGISNYSQSPGSIGVSNVPEPTSSIALMILGAAGLVSRKRRR